MPSSVTATGITGDALSKMESLIAATTSFQAETGAASTAVAKERIYYPHLENTELDDSWLENMPYVILTPGPLSATKDSDSTWDYGGRVAVLFRSEAKYSTNDPSTLKDAIQSFLNYTDGVLLELMTNSNVSDAITLQSFTEVLPVQLSPPMEQSERGPRRPYFDRAFDFTFNPVGSGGGA